MSTPGSQVRRAPLSSVSTALAARLGAAAIAAVVAAAAGCAPAGDEPVPPDVTDAGPAEGDLAVRPDLGAPDLMPMPVRCTGKVKLAPGTSMRMVMSRGQQRSYYLLVPSRYDPTLPTSLVLAFHGLSDKAGDYMRYISLELEAERRNVIAIVPQGLGFVPGWNAGNCCGEPQLFGIDDVGFARDLIDGARRELCIDDKRIFAMGFSNGGMFSHRVACELSGIVAAVGPVSGGPMVTTCQPERPVSILHMHGTADPIVGYEGGGTGTFPSIPTVISDWMKRNRCTDTLKETYKKGSVTCKSAQSCAEGTEVSLCTIDQGKHTWPGSSDGTMDIKATSEILDFFARHAR